MRKRLPLFEDGLSLEPDLSRRRFVQGLSLGALAAGLGVPATRLIAGTGQVGALPELRGTQFDLVIGPTGVNFTGRPRTATTINGSIPAPVLRWREGDRVTLRVTNQLPEETSIHWHGIILPSSQDGVPHVSDNFPGIAPGETFVYSFDVKQTGTYWYHSHSGWQEQTGMYGPIVIEPRGGESIRADRDYVVMLSDWTDENPNRIYAKLKKLSHYYNFNERTVKDLWRDIREKGVARTFQDRHMWNMMRMSDRDLSDVTGYTYTFLMNGVPPATGWIGLFKRGEKVRLRIINGAAMTFFDFRIPGLKMTVVAADGQEVEPFTVDEFRIGVAETYDVIVEPKDDRAYTLFAQAIDRTGYARGTLTPDPAMLGEVPEMDPLPILTHMDMGMAHHMGHGGMGHGGSGYGGGMDHAGVNHGAGTGMDHSKMNHGSGGMDHSKMQHGSGGMDHAAMGHGGGGGMDHAGMQHGAGGMDHAAMGHGKGPGGPGMAGYGSANEVIHHPTEFGPQVDMRAEAPMARLDDPGVGLRDNGRRVLTYADLKNRHRTPDPREPRREIQLHLTGNMSRYMWSMNGIRFADAEDLPFEYGERLRIVLVNDTMMNHPIHLHGMWSDLETGDPDHIPRKHTVIVQPGAKISYLVTADAMGGWAYHCHLLYHMPGMFRKVVVR
ncbi:MAG TPA: copper resistance system multicopper oxidase [Chromatiales bacterium]|nr:copper resistance system multicopper oxidase [Chromatiales bacterium]